MEITGTFYSCGTPLYYVLTIPDSTDSNERLPAVLLCHGHSRFHGDGLDALAQRLCESGIISLRFNFRGCGAAAQRRYHLYCASDWPQDLQSALSFAQSIPQIDPNRLGVAGISMGACTALYTAGMDRRICSVVSMAGIADCAQWLQGVWHRSGGDWGAFRKRIEADHIVAAATGHSQVVHVLDMYNDTKAAKDALILESLSLMGINSYVSLDSLFDLLHYKPIEHCARIRSKAFLIHGADDSLVPGDNAQALFDAIPQGNKKLSVYVGIDHNIPRHPHRETVFKDIVTWFMSSL